MFSNVLESFKVYEQFDTETIKNALMEKGEVVKFGNAAHLTLKENEILFVIDGSVIVKKTTNISNNLHLGIADLFTPFGLIEVHYPHIAFEYKALTDVTVISITYDDLNSLMSQRHDVSKAIIRILMQLNVMLTHAVYERGSGNGFFTVTSMLHRYLDRAEMGYRNHESISTFILKRTRLSQSYVFQVISELKKGGYINVENGELVSINKRIPDKF
jgi:CRP-like cAMP-binding protein